MPDATLNASYQAHKSTVPVGRIRRSRRIRQLRTNPDATPAASYQAYKRRYLFWCRTPLTPAITGLVPRKNQSCLLSTTHSKLW